MRNPRVAAYAALLIGMTSIGFSAMFVRWSDMPGVVSGFYRQHIGLVALTPLLIVQFRRARASGRATVRWRGVWIALLAGVFFAGDVGTWNTSVFHTTAANATLLANTAPIYVGLGAVLVFKERLRAVFWVGLAVALAGAALIVREDIQGAAGMGFGDLLALIAGFLYGLYLLAISRARKSIDALTASWLSNLCGGLVLLGVSIALGHDLGGFTSQQWWALVGMGLVSQALGYMGINYALGKLPAPLVSATLLGQPIVTAIFAIPLLGEGLTLTQIIGGVVTLVGIYLVNRSQAPPVQEAEIQPVSA